MKIAVLGTWDGLLVGRFVGALVDAGVAIDCIILDAKETNPRDLSIHEERTRGRLPAVPLHKFAAEQIPLFAVENHNDPEATMIARNREVGILVNAGTPRILKSAMLEAPSIGVLNCHPGLLPDYRGSSCVEWALFNNAPVGNTVHLMTEGIDEGDVLCTEPVPYAVGTPYSGIRTAVYEAAFALMAKACKGLADGRYTRADFQPQQGGTYYKPIDRESMDRVRQRFPEVA